MPWAIPPFFYELNSNLGGKLLWTNPSPTSAFAAQTISLDISKYDGVIVEFRYNTVDDSIATRVYAKPTDTFVRFGAGCLSSGPAYGRVFHVTSNGIEFKDGISGTVVQNTMLIPYKIYGVNLSLQ